MLLEATVWWHYLAAKVTGERGNSNCRHGRVLTPPLYLSTVNTRMIPLGTLSTTRHPNCMEGVSQSRVYKLTTSSLFVDECSINMSLNVVVNKLNINFKLNNLIKSKDRNDSN